MTARPSLGRPTRGGLALGALVIVIVALVIVTVQPSGPSVPTASPSGPVTTTPTSLPSPDASPEATDIAYDAVFEGDPTGSSDMTQELAAFFEANSGGHVALPPDAVYLVTELAFTATDLTVDFRGAMIKGTEVGSSGIVRLSDAQRVTLNDPWIEGTGYAWEADGESNQDPNQFEHGIWIDGGSDITINRPITRQTRGDGIYIGYESGSNGPASGVLILDADIERASRNGIAPVAGEVTIRGGRIDQVGLHGIDFEPNHADGAESIVGIVQSIDIRRVGDLPDIERDSYAVAAGGNRDGMKSSITIEGLTGDRLDILVRDTEQAVVTGNVSDRLATATFPTTGSVTFEGNTRIARRD